MKFLDNISRIKFLAERDVKKNRVHEYEECLNDIVRHEENLQNKIFELETESRQTKEKNQLTDLKIKFLENKNQALLTYIDRALRELGKVGYFEGADSRQRTKDILVEALRESRKTDQ